MNVENSPYMRRERFKVQFFDTVCDAVLRREEHTTNTFLRENKIFSNTKMRETFKRERQMRYEH